MCLSKRRIRLRLGHSECDRAMTLVNRSCTGCFMWLRDVRIAKELAGTIPCVAKVPWSINDSKVWLDLGCESESASYWPERGLGCGLRGSYCLDSVTHCWGLSDIRLIVNTDMLALTLSDTLFSPCRCHLY